MYVQAVSLAPGESPELKAPCFFKIVSRLRGLNTHAGIKRRAKSMIMARTQRIYEQRTTVAQTRSPIVPMMPSLRPSAALPKLATVVGSEQQRTRRNPRNDTGPPCLEASAGAQKRSGRHNAVAPPGALDN